MWFYCPSNEPGRLRAQDALSIPFHPTPAESDTTEVEKTTAPRSLTAVPRMMDEQARRVPPYPEFVENERSIITPPNCSDSVELLIVVMSPSGDFDARRAIRSSWGNLKSQSHHKVIYSMGFAHGSDDRVKTEAYEFQDVLRGNFLDVYLKNNLHTMKALAAFKWATVRCSGLQYILATPSDSFVNVPQTTVWLKSLNEDSEKLYKRDFYAGSCEGIDKQGPAAVRDPLDLRYIPTSYWPDSRLPVYASRVGMMMSIYVAGWMVSASTEVGDETCDQALLLVPVREGLERNLFRLTLQSLKEPGGKEGPDRRL